MVMGPVGYRENATIHITGILLNSKKFLDFITPGIIWGENIAFNVHVDRIISSFLHNSSTVQFCVDISLENKLFTIYEYTDILELGIKD